MPVAADKTQFDCIAFRKYLRLFDSSVEGERHAALNAALRQCAQHHPPLLFFEASALAFGSNKKELDVLIEKVAALQAERDEFAMQYRQLEGKATELADQVLEATQTIERLAAKREREEGRGSHNFKQLLADLWAMPQIRLLLVSAIAILQLYAFPINEHSGSVLPNLSIGILQIYLYCKWAALQFRLDGLLQLLIKMALYTLGPITCILIAASDPASEKFVVHNDTAWLTFLLLTFTFLALSRLAEWLVEDVGRRVWDSEPFQILRRCF